MVKEFSLLDIKTVYLEPEVKAYGRGMEILCKFSNAHQIEVPSHWLIASLHGNKGCVQDWNKIKENTLVLGVKKSLAARPNYRSAHFIAPSQSNGCAMSCAYCYVPRRKGYANPITVFVNIESICAYLERHAQKQGKKASADFIDPRYWVYEIGENSDCAIDDFISSNVRDIIFLFKQLPNAKATFATKFVNLNMLTYDPQQKTRIRFSLMPECVSKVVDVRTSPIQERIAAVNDFVEAGYEVHLNFSPVIYYPTWLEDYQKLFKHIDDVLNIKAKEQLKCEVIFLTHNEGLHEVNMLWHPKGEELLWKPDLQEEKLSQNGAKNVRYKLELKSRWIKAFKDLIQKNLPYCPIKYMF